MKRILITSLLLGLVAIPAQSIELQRDTVDAWHEYVRASGARMQERLRPGKPYLWTDEAPERALKVRRGEIVVEPAVGDGLTSVPKGLIHDWVGAVFIPNTTIDEVFAVLGDYDSYKEIYKPAVTDSRVLGRSDAGEEFTMTWRRRVLFVTASMQGWYKSNDFAVSPHRRYSVAESTRIQQVERHGQRDERYLPADTGSGFIWRLLSMVRCEQRDGGVYLEIEALALTRDIPASLQWMVSPVVRRLSMNSLATTLEETRDAVRGSRTKLARVSRRDTKQPK